MEVLTGVPHPIQLTVPGSLLAIFLVYLFSKYQWRPTGKFAKTEIETKSSSQDPEDSIDLSSVHPMPAFDLEGTPEIQYRPFREGKYHLTMAISKMPEDSWIELDNTYRKKMEMKRHLLETQRDIVTAFSPEGWEASFEVLELQVDFITKRFPNLFSKTPAGVRNHIMNEEWDLRRESPLWETWYPTEVMGLLTLDDYVIMVKDKVPRPDQEVPEYHVRAGTVCFPGGWKVKDKLGLSVFQLHAGKVPEYESKIALSMNRFFQRLKVREPVQRFNYHIDPSPDLFHPTSHHNTDRGPAPLEELYFRVERQCLRRLPKTRAIIFQIRTYLYPVAEMLNTTPAVMHQPNYRVDEVTAARWRASIDHLDGPIARYKNKGVWEAAVVAALDKWLREHGAKPVDTSA